ncbi:hypothetical protein AAG570_010391 [Ranatra chinensis]|uniref:Angiotensin-converting enzyme n=1 Tax=Ranatra chinensis TaxID=642074 RepID=A0ABD0YME5_9HEMI
MNHTQNNADNCFNREPICYRYFVATVLQFQIHRKICREAAKEHRLKTSVPLHKCDIYRSKAAGRALVDLMEKGSSRTWQEVLSEATGESRLDGNALREYFAPLEEWLRNENIRTQEPIDGDYCKRSIETANLQVYGGFYNTGVVAETSIFVIVFLLLQLLFQ